ncbi:LCP family protein [Streptomyces sp. AV19]|uniref:LCP family protein n=1 Tax=Streptomyces sp. AV19 TaxID=2793068 RepID=UPI0018FEE5E0|nr:LCP family protein [Streptomyces sp. AV19]MBH1937071.1 LCP family protein [Streptomyces sp. AV19]MDG4535910.1 LCP family protein [Streptomyces sp. AV19]
MTGEGGRPVRRLRPAGAVGLALLLLLVLGAGWVLLELGGNISTFGADGIARDRPGAAAGQNVLVIGSDSRAGGNRALGGGTGDVGRSDTAFLLHVYEDGSHATAVSIPRDTLLEIPPCRLPDGSWTSARSRAMFNSAFTVGGTAQGNPACTQNTVEKLTGLRVDHTVVVDFAGFSSMTDAVGGVEVCLPRDVRQGDLDPNRGSPGEVIFRKGRQTVSGQKALDYVRVRHGIGDGSDIGRIRRQQAFIASMIEKVRSQGMNPTTLLPLARAATKSLTVDPGLGSVDKLLSFALSFKDIGLRDITFVTMPWRYEGDRVAVVQPDADALWAALRQDRPAGATSDAKRVGGRVAVTDASGVPGLAGRVSARMKERGWTVTGTRAADGRTEGITVIEFGPGQAKHARALAGLFPGAFVRGTAAEGVSVTLGRDAASVPAPRAPRPEPLSAGTADTDGTRAADDDPCSDLSYG